MWDAFISSIASLLQVSIYTVYLIINNWNAVPKSNCNIANSFEESNLTKQTEKFCVNFSSFEEKWIGDMNVAELHLMDVTLRWTNIIGYVVIGIQQY